MKTIQLGMVAKNLVSRHSRVYHKITPELKAKCKVDETIDPSTIVSIREVKLAKLCKRCFPR